jgi:B9 domain-containing protein 2
MHAASYLGMAPRLDDDLSDMGFLTDMRVREEAGPYISSIGAGSVHLRIQMLFRVSHGMGMLSREAWE